MTTQERASVTLGTLGDLGLNGKLIDDAAPVMLGWAKSIDSRRCRICHRRLRAVVGDGSRIITARIKDSNDPLTRCDDCWAKKSDEPSP